MASYMAQLSLESCGTLLYCLLPSCITCSDCIPQFVFISGVTLEPLIADCVRTFSIKTHWVGRMLWTVCTINEIVNELMRGELHTSRIKHDIK